MAPDTAPGTDARGRRVFLSLTTCVFLGALLAAAVMQYAGTTGSPRTVATAMIALSAVSFLATAVVLLYTQSRRATDRRRALEASLE